MCATSGSDGAKRYVPVCAALFGPRRGTPAVRFFAFGSDLRSIGATGFEPAALWSQTTRSTKLSYAPPYRERIVARGLAAAKSVRQIAEVRVESGGAAQDVGDFV